MDLLTILCQKDVERVKAKIKTGEDIDAHEILRPVLFMLDDMRRNIRHIRKKNGHRGGEMEIVNGGDSNGTSNGNFRHSLMNVNVKDINKNIGALQMYTQLKSAPSFIVTTSTMTADIKEAKIQGYQDPIFKARTKSKQGAGKKQKITLVKTKVILLNLYKPNLEAIEAKLEAIEANFEANNHKM